MKLEDDPHYIEYINILSAVRDFLVTDKKESTCVEIFKDIISKAYLKSPEAYTIISKDLSRYFSNFFEYRNLLGKMDDVPEMRKKLISEKFFNEFFKEDSNNFFETRRWAGKLKDKELNRKITTHLNCIITSVFRSLKRKYGLC